MRKEEIVNLINEEIENKNFSKKCDLLIVILVSVFCLIIMFSIVDVLKYNATHKTYDKELDFCKSIYESDKVVLEQCKDYFVILGGDKNE